MQNNIDKIQYSKEINPVIVSASRATDIIGCHLEWFKKQLNKGYTFWKNPFNQQIQKVNFINTRAFIFWTKDPITMLKNIKLFENLNFYVHITINNHEPETFEPNLPPLSERIHAFIELSKTFGKEKIIWRFDPLIVTPNLPILKLVTNIEKIAEKIASYTEKLVISFVDIDEYRCVKQRFKKFRIKYKNLDLSDINDIAEKLQLIGERYKILIATCAENYNLEDYNITKNSCIDANLLLKLYKCDEKLASYILQNKSKVFNKFKKDKGQRKFCNCLPSKDIGMYNSCRFRCIYCYATR